MATYAIGDVQGCFLTLEKLIAKIRFDPAADRLWFAGDLVNRGPRSLEVLRFVSSLGDGAVTVLGNHDLHLIALATGAGVPKKKDTLQPILEAPDRKFLIDWLRRRPLSHREGDFFLIHAGLLPGWTVAAAEERARQAEAALQGNDGERLLRSTYEELTAENEEATGWFRLRETIAVLTRARICDAAGQPVWHFSAPLLEIPGDCRPWFDFENGANPELTVLFGHWAALGYFSGKRVICLDSGCVWGRALTAVRLEDRVVFQEPMSDS